MGNDSLAIARRAGLALSLMALGTLLILRLSSFIETHSNGESGSYRTVVATTAHEGWLGILSSIPAAWLLLAAWALGFTAVLVVFAKRRHLRGSTPEDIPIGNRQFSRKDHARHIHRKLLAATMICLVVAGGFAFFVALPAAITGQGQTNRSGVNLGNLSSVLSQVGQTGDSKGLGYSGQRKMVADSLGNIYVAYRKVPSGLDHYEVYVAVSRDNGKTWSDLGASPAAIVSAPPLVNSSTEGGGNGADQRVPAVAVDSKGWVHVVWYGRDQAYSGTNDRQIKYACWNGTQWSNWVNISPVLGYSGQLYWQEHSIIAVDRNDVLHVLWEGSDSSSGGVQQIKHSMSTDNGRTWSRWENISPLESSGQSRPDGVVDTSGNLYAAWYGGVLGQSGTRIKYARWDAGTAAWGSVQIVAGIEGFNQKHVSMTIDRSNQLHLIWDGTDNAHPNSLVKYSSLNPNLTAATWTTWTNVYPRSQLNQSDPTLSTGERGMVFVAWQEWSGIDAASSNSAKSFIVQMSQDSTLTQLGTSFSANNKWPVMPQDSSDGILRIAWLSGAGSPYTICYSQTSTKNR